MNWRTEEDDRLKDLVFETNNSLADMATILNKPEWAIHNRMEDLEIDWVKRKSGYASRGQAALTHLMRKLIPGEEITTEHHIGDRLRLDVYCPTYNLAAEYHGRQHFEFVEHFHNDVHGFRAAQKRDDRKVELCKEKGIALVVFRYCDKLSEEIVFERLLDALRNGPPVVKEEKFSRYKGNPYYERYMERQRQYRKKLYKKSKASKG